MRKIIGLLVFLLVIGATAFYLIRNNLATIVPPSKDIKQYLPLSQETVSPFTIPSGLKLDVFADLKGGLPRVLAFDKNNVLFASLTANGKVVALPDSNKDFRADNMVEVLKGLNKPHGILFNEGFLYVAESDAVSRYYYNAEELSVSGKEVLFTLPAGGRHFTRTIRIKDNKLYTSVGSSCDVCVEKENTRASILVSNLDGSDLKVYAKGLRNTVFFTFDNEGRMWGTDMGRDNLGDSLPPDEINLITENKNYGWPYCYGDGAKDTKFSSDSKFICQDTESPKYKLDAHVAPLGLVFINSPLFGAEDQGSLLVALHGSWNSSQRVGYKIIKLARFAEDLSNETDLITGFLQKGKEVLGRPVDLIFDSGGNLFISDDKTGLIYVLTK